MAKKRALQEAARTQQDEFYTDRHDVGDDMTYGKKFIINGRFVYKRILIRKIADFI